MAYLRFVVLTALFLASAGSRLLSQSVGASEDDRSVEDVVRDVYDLVSWTDDQTPDWEDVRRIFIPEAVIVLRYPPGLQVMSVDDFLQDWLRFEARLAEAGWTGFREAVLSTEVFEFGDVAQVRVIYESSIPGRDRPPQPGVDLWSLIRVEGRWRVASVVNELPRHGLPVPDPL